jgi:hypothetical protein
MSKCVCTDYEMQIEVDQPPRVSRSLFECLVPYSLTDRERSPIGPCNVPAAVIKFIFRRSVTRLD